MWPAMVWWLWWQAVLELPRRDDLPQHDQKAHNQATDRPAAGAHAGQNPA